VPGVITKRVEGMQAKAPGTRETIKLQYGPYVLGPGSDASYVNLEMATVQGFGVTAKPKIRYADGTRIPHEDMVHLHHAHLFRQDFSDGEDSSDHRDGMEWVFGTGDEQTEGSFEKISDAAGASRNQYGIEFADGEQMLMVWMPMNMGSSSKTIFLEFEFEFIHGSAEEIEKATGKQMNDTEGVMYGETFNVPKTGGDYAWPLDVKLGPEDAYKDGPYDHESFQSPAPERGGSVKPGVGHIWTAPKDGVLLGMAGHMHEGGKMVTFGNLGSESNPCGDDGDRYPGTTIFNSEAYYPPGIYPTHMKMGTTQPGWRAYVKKGDRIAINGVYDTSTYAFPDQMSVVGIYWDDDAQVSDGRHCRAELVNEPQATHDEIVKSVPYQDAKRGDDGSSKMHAMKEPCVADGCNDYDAPPLPKGAATDTIGIQDFKFSVGDQRNGSFLSQMLGAEANAAPVVKRGTKLKWVNYDFVRNAGARHSITSCHGPCNGPNAMSYPNSSGLYYSGPMGYLPLSETASSETQGTPTYELDTSQLEPGYHTYYCFNHRWMRGAFYVE
jgi:plastocyanin